jgi:hypothetical protein
MTKMIYGWQLQCRRWNCIWRLCHQRHELCSLHKAIRERPYRPQYVCLLNMSARINKFQPQSEYKARSLPYRFWLPGLPLTNPLPSEDYHQIAGSSTELKLRASSMPGNRTRRFAYSNTIASDRTWYWAGSIHLPSSRTISLRSILMLSSFLTLGISSRRFPTDPQLNCVCFPSRHPSPS